MHDTVDVPLMTVPCQIAISRPRKTSPPQWWAVTLLLLNFFLEKISLCFEVIIVKVCFYNLTFFTEKMDEADSFDQTSLCYTPSNTASNMSSPSNELLSTNEVHSIDFDHLLPGSQRTGDTQELQTPSQISAEKLEGTEGLFDSSCEKVQIEVFYQEDGSLGNDTPKKLQEEDEKEPVVSMNQRFNFLLKNDHYLVPIGNNQDQNQVIRTWGQISDIKITDKRGGLNHHKVLQALGGYDPDRGQKVAGHRGYFLKGVGVLLNNALINYGINFLHKLGYDLVQPPYFMKKEIMAETCQLSDLDDQLYKVSGSQNEDYYLIATSEQPISAMHREEWIEEASLPIRYGGISSCFRKEAGTHGKDTQGIFRVHQFQKIEQFYITKPEDSWKMFEQMIDHSEQFYQYLGLPYRVVIVSGALNNAASKKYDLEAWFPGYNAYRELVSCSNCTDYQSRSLGIRCGIKKKDETEKKYVHMLHGTLCATERTLCCILENYQTPEGLKIPTVLQPYLGTDFLPYKPEEDQKEKKKEKKEEKPEKPQKEEEKAKEEEEEKKIEGQ